MDSMDSKPSPNSVSTDKRERTAKFVTTPLLKLYQTNRTSEDGRPEGRRTSRERGGTLYTICVIRRIRSDLGGAQIELQVQGWCQRFTPATDLRSKSAQVSVSQMDEIPNWIFLMGSDEAIPNVLKMEQKDEAIKAT